jgi:hypothetical protein
VTHRVQQDDHRGTGRTADGSMQIVCHESSLQCVITEGQRAISSHLGTNSTYCGAAFAERTDNGHHNGGTRLGRPAAIR